MLDRSHEEEPKEGDGTFLKKLTKEMEGVEISVSFRDTLKTLLMIVSTLSPTLKGKEGGQKKELQRHLIVVTPSDFGFLGFSNLHWQTRKEKEELCQTLLDSLIGLEGVPVLKLKRTVKFPQHHDYFEECLEEGWSMTNCKRKERSLWKKDPPNTKRPPFHLQFGDFWECKDVFPAASKYQVSELNMQRGSDVGVKERRDNFLHARASVEKEGKLKFQMYHPAKQKMHNIELSVDNWYRLGYGPLQWMSWECRVFLCERICSGMYWETVDVVKVETEATPTLISGIEGTKETKVLRQMQLQTNLTPAVSCHKLRVDGVVHNLEVVDKGKVFVVTGDNGLKFTADASHWTNTPHRCLKWLPVPTWMNLGIRILREITMSPSSTDLMLTPKKLQFWRTITDKIRVGKIFVSAFDTGKSVEINSMDYNGKLLESVDLPYKEIASPLSRARTCSS